MKRLLWLSLALSLVSVAAAQAQPAPGYRYGPSPYGMTPHGMTPRAQPGEAAVAVVRGGIDKLLEFLGQEERPNRLQVAAFLDREIAPYFDFDHMARWVAGRAYANMNKDRRIALAKKLEASFLGALAKHLARYEDQQVRYFRPRRGRGDTVTVSMGVLRPGNYPSKLDFRMYLSADGWKVFDVVANGRSAASFYRARFRRATSPSPYASRFAR
jgi:phospholipid transport system substrate-binding protein